MGRRCITLRYALRDDLAVAAASVLTAMPSNCRTRSHPRLHQTSLSSPCSLLLTEGSAVELAERRFTCRLSRVN